MNVTATAHKWSHGWELHLDGQPATQARHLRDAPTQVRDYLDAEDPTTNHSTWNITVVPDIGPLYGEAMAAREATAQAAAATRDAATGLRAVAHQLRQAGYSAADVATILGVTTPRVYQLTTS